MTSERAQYILANRILGGSFRYAFPRQFEPNGGTIYADGITKQEDEAIKSLWRTMPGFTCYYDAVVRIAYGKKLCGTESDT